MTKVVLITAQPRIAATGAATTIRLAGGGDRKGYYYGGQHFRSGVASAVRFQASIEVDDSGWTGGSVPTTAGVVFAPYAAPVLTELAAYVWKDAAITIEEGSEDTEVFTTRLVGKVADATVQNDKLVITVADFAASLNKPLITARFAGTGGVEGGDEAKGRAKRRSWGRVFNVEGRVLDKLNNIYEFGDPAFPMNEFTTIKDMGRAASSVVVVTWQGTALATLTALKAAVAPQGGGCVAPSIACVKWWTQPSGPLTADLKGEVGTGYVETVSSIAERVLQAVSGPSISNVANGNILRDGVAGIHVDENETVANVLDRLFLPVSLLWILIPNGSVSIREFSFTSPVEILKSDSVQRTKSLAPVKTRRIGYQKAYRTHGDGEIATSILYADGSSIDNLQPKDPGATNNQPTDELVKNSSFEAGPNPDGSLPGWTEEGLSAGQQLTRYAIAGGRGSYSGLLTGKEAIHGARFGVLPGETVWYTLRSAINAGRGGTQNPGDTSAIFASIRFYDAAGAYVGDATIINDAARAAGGGFIMKSDAAMVPAGARYAEPYWTQDWAYGSSLTQSFIDEFDVARHEFVADVTRDFDAPQQIIINCDETGTPYPGQLPRNVQYRLLENGTNVAGAAIWGTPLFRIGSGAATMTAGMLQIASIGATDAELRISATYQGKTRSCVLQVHMELADPVRTANSARDNTITSVASTSMAVVSDELEVSPGPIGNINVNFIVNYLTDLVEARTRYMVAIFQRWNGAAWIDVDSEQVGQYPTSVAIDPVSGIYETTAMGLCAISKTFYGESGPVKLRVRARVQSGGGNLFPYGYFSMEGV